MRSFVSSGLSFIIPARVVRTFFDLSFITIVWLPVAYSMSPGMSICVALFIFIPRSEIGFLARGGGGGGASTGAELARGAGGRGCGGGGGRGGGGGVADRDV